MDKGPNFSLHKLLGNFSLFKWPIHVFWVFYLLLRSNNHHDLCQQCPNKLPSVYYHQKQSLEQRLTSKCFSSTIIHGTTLKYILSSISGIPTGIVPISHCSHPPVVTVTVAFLSCFCHFSTLSLMISGSSCQRCHKDLDSLT